MLDVLFFGFLVCCLVTLVIVSINVNEIVEYVSKKASSRKMDKCVSKEKPAQKIDDETEQTKYVNTLTVRTKHGTWEWTQTVDTERVIVEPWKDFYKWFFVKTTPYYMFKHKSGETLIVRDEVIDFWVNVKKM